MSDSRARTALPVQSYSQAAPGIDIHLITSVISHFLTHNQLLPLLRQDVRLLHQPQVVRHHRRLPLCPLLLYHQEVERTCWPLSGVRVVSRPYATSTTTLRPLRPLVDQGEQRDPGRVIMTILRPEGLVPRTVVIWQLPSRPLSPSDEQGRATATRRARVTMSGTSECKNRRRPDTATAMAMAMAIATASPTHYAWSSRDARMHRYM